MFEARVPKGCPYASELITSAETLLRLANPKQSEIAWLGKRLRDGVATMYADQPVTVIRTNSERDEDDEDDERDDGIGDEEEVVRTGATLRCLKSVGIIDSTPAAILPYVQHLEAHARWDPFFARGRIVEAYSDTVDVRHCVYRSKRCSLVRSRSFVFVIQFVALPHNGGYLVAARSVKHPKAPRDRTTVRGRVESSGWLLLPLGAQRTVVTHIQLIDFAGRIPRRVYDFVQSRLPRHISHIRQLVMDDAKKAKTV